MVTPFLLIFFSLSAFSENPQKIQVIPNPKTSEDFEHEHKGCPENSECDAVMGLQLTRWKDLIKKLKDDKIEGTKKAQFLELFRSKYGIPVEFYTRQKSQQGFKPLLFDSHCKDHNQKGKEKVLRGIAFLKSLSKEKATVWRDQTQIEVPVGEILIPQPVPVYTDGGPVEYQLPLGDQPLYIQNKELVVIKEEDDLFYALKVKVSGEWRIDYVDFTKLSGWEDKSSEVPCPKDKIKLAPKDFGVEFCKSIWDEDLKKNVTVKLFQGCPT